MKYCIFRLIGTQTWIRWGLRYRLFCQLKPVDRKFIVPFFGSVYSGNLNNFIDRAVYFYGAHEREPLLFMGSKLTSDSVVLDIGANVGHHSLYFSQRAKVVHAFEPNPAFKHAFDRHMQENNVTNVFLHPVGLGEVDSEAPYYAPTGDNQGVGSFVAEHWKGNENIGTLTIRNGDDMVAELGLTRLDFIKIDVERYEESVLKGLQKTLRKFKPLIVMEYAKRDFSSEESFRTHIAGYTPYLLEANTSVAYFFNDPACRPLPFDYARAKSEILLVPTLP
jgi:FkbM family methyltransferase